MPQRSRASHSKSRNGCDACKARHKKCDELKPSCTGCKNVAKVCTYSKASSQNRQIRQGGRRRQLLGQQRLQRSLSEHYVDVLTTDVELRSFENFVTLTMPTFDYASTLAPWTHILYAMQWRYPFLRQCCAAVGALHGNLQVVAASTAHPISKIETKAGQSHRQLHLQALKSIRKAIDKDEYDPIALMLTCILLTFYALINGDRTEVAAHLAMGLHFLQGRTATGDEGAVSSALRIVGFQVIHSDLGGDEMGPIRRLLQGYNTIPTDEDIVDIATAREKLYWILPSIMSLSKQAPGGERSFEQCAVAVKIEHVLMQWRAKVDAIYGPNMIRCHDQAAASLLNAVFNKAMAWLGSLEKHKLQYPVSPMREIVRYAQKYIDIAKCQNTSISFCTGLIPMLTLVAEEESDMQLRLTALDLLLEIPRQEASWDAISAWKSAAAIIENDARHVIRHINEVP